MALPGETVGLGADGPEKDPNIRGPKVMQSAGGFYVGYGYFNEEYGFEEPYSRESGYYRTPEEAEVALQDFLGPEPAPDLNFHARGDQFDPTAGLTVETYDDLDQESPGHSF